MPAAASASPTSPGFEQLFQDTTRLDSLRGGVPPTSNPSDTISQSLIRQLADSLRRSDSLKTLRRRVDGDSLKVLRRHAEEDSVEFPRDSLNAGKDSLGKADSTWVAYLDSTVRIEQFVYRRHDTPMAELIPHDNYSLYLDVKSPAYKREFELDSTGHTVTVRERVNGLDVKLPLTVSLDEYIKQRRESEHRASWGRMVKNYRFAESRDELGGVFNNLKNIEIPIPANPLFSIFGGRGIKLNVSGAVDIHAAFRNSKSDAATTSRFDQSSSTPDFNQDVQILVDGLIGDKLKIRADWNTQRTFDFENQLKIDRKSVV